MPGNPSAADSNESELAEILCFFKDFMREPDQGPVDLGGTHQLRLFAYGSHNGEKSQANTGLVPLQPGAKPLGKPVDVIQLLQRTYREDVHVGFFELNFQVFGGLE